MTKRTPKKQFAAIPVKAILDRRLSATDWRVLAAIARSDSFGINGRHCYACQETIGIWAATDRTSASRSINRLAEWGYIEKRPLKDRYEYKVIYSECDEYCTPEKARCVERSTSGVPATAHINKETKYTELNSEIDSAKLLPQETREPTISNPQGRLAKIERDSKLRGYLLDSEEAELADIEELALTVENDLSMALEGQLERIQWNLDR